MSQRYKQGNASERYSQPFKSVARLLDFCHARGMLSRIRVTKVAKRWFRYFYKPFHQFCVLPDALLIGASKCGTSSLANHLSSHPDCMPPFYKEIRYFDSSRIPIERFDTYKAYFPSSARRYIKQLLSGRRAWTADFSPTYYDHPHAPRRIFETLGADVKLILLLRNPVDRAYSQYRFQRGIGNESETSFEKALELEQQRIAGEDAKQLANESYFSRPRNHFGYLTRSYYLSYIKNWHQYFNASQLLVISLEDFKKSPQPVFNQICDFIGVPHHRISKNIHNISKIEETMNTETRLKLLAHFRQHNRELSDYLGQDFDWDH